MKTSWFHRYLLPGFVLKSVIIGGGYATGREFVTFFLAHGPWGAMLGVGVATAAFSLVYAASLEFARTFHAYDYRSFFGRLLGRGWIAFETLYLAMMLLVLSVITATAGAIAAQEPGLPHDAVVLAFTLLVVLLAFFGSRAIEDYMVFWSFVLYGFYLTFVVLSLGHFGHQALAKFAADSAPLAAGFDGVRYAGYNISAITATLFCARHLRRRREAITAGLLAGPLAMLPGTLCLVAMAAFYPQINGAPVPIDVLLSALGLKFFRAAFLVVLFTALVGTGVALIHALNERIAATRGAGVALSRRTRALVALVVMMLTLLLASRVGLAALIEKGYGVLTFGFIALFMVPILTVGIARITASASRAVLVGADG